MRAAGALRDRRRQQAKHHGLTLEQLHAMRVEQRGRCAVCGAREPDVRLCVDHCHATDAVRELLCGGCNTALGMLGEDPERIRALAAYAEKWQAMTALLGPVEQGRAVA
jgi:hypothetical protein